MVVLLLLRGQLGDNPYIYAFQAHRTGSAWFTDFSQVSDGEVVRLLDDARRGIAPA